MWVLIVMIGVNSGNIISFQEFTSEENCRKAKTVVVTNDRTSRIFAECVKK